jgi:excisionase family DNA binding protein
VYNQPLADPGRRRKQTVTELLTIDETAALLKLSDRTVYEMLRNGRLPGAAKLAGKWRVDRDKLLAWVAKGGELAGGTKPSEKK